MVGEEGQEGGLKKVKRNCFWQSTTATDDDADAAAARMLRGASLAETLRYDLFNRPR